MNDEVELPWPAFGPTRGAADLLARLEASGTEVGEVIDGGAAKVTDFDRVALADFEKRTGRQPRSLEADIVATTTGLFYVSPHAGYWFHLGEWHELTVRIIGTRWRISRLEVAGERDRVPTVIKLNRQRAKNIEAIAKHYRRRWSDSLVGPTPARWDTSLFPSLSRQGSGDIVAAPNGIVARNTEDGGATLARLPWAAIEHFAAPPGQTMFVISGNSQADGCFLVVEPDSEHERTAWIWMLRSEGVPESS